MTISAGCKAADSGLLDGSLELYRDLSVALRERIACLKKGGGSDADCKEHLEAVRSHQKVLQTVLDIEASLVKRNKAFANGGSVELDLTAARAEIAARLAVWLAAG